MLKFYDVHKNSRQWIQNRNNCLSYLCTTLLLLVFSFTASAQTHTGLTNPLKEGWTVSGTDNGTASPVISDSDYPSVNAWQINISPNADSARARLRYEAVGPGSTESWTFQTRMRVVDPDSEYNSFDQLIEIANGGTRFIVTFGSDNGNTEISPILQSEQDSGITAPPEVVVNTATPGQTEYFNLAITYNASEGSADIFVNNVEVFSDFTGFTDTSNPLLQRVNFGDGSGTSNLTSNLRFAMVDYQTGAQACRDGNDNDGDGNLGFAGGDEDCLSPNDPTESAYCALGEDIDNDGYCEQVIARNYADNNPVSAGWAKTEFSPTVTTKGVDSDPGANNCEAPCGYWEIIDTSQSNPSRGNFTFPISAEQYTNNLGWSYGGRLRILPFTSGTAENIDFASTLVMQIVEQEINKEFFLTFGISEEYKLLMRNTLSGTTVDVGPSNDFHYFELVFDPDRQVVDVLVDGELIFEGDQGGLPVFNGNRILWGSTANAGKKHTLFNEVIFEIAPDTDNDGIPDMEERRAANPTDPFKFDTDADGISDSEEILLGLNPSNSDSDGDGLLDGYEVSFGFDPFVADADLDAEPDGLINSAEQLAGTDPTNPDSDGDGLTDGDEVNVYGTDPTDTDSDNDQLPDEEEVNTHQTDPNLVDTDLDGLTDGSELTEYFTNALNSDTDNDGLLDGLEVSSYNTDPLEADSDGDGLTDRFEILYSSLDPLVTNDATLDEDGDGLSFLAEQTSGTDPTTQDSDGDGINDNVEIALDSNPNNIDTDNDGLTDTFENQFGLLLTVAGDALLDNDSDGLSNLEEQENGTDPTNHDSDSDGVVDGQEVNINNTDPNVADTGVIGSEISSNLSFVSNGEPLFTEPPPREEIDLLGDDLLSELQAGGQIRHVHNVKGEVPLRYWQAAWDRGLAQCRAREKIDESDGFPDACKTTGFNDSTGGNFFVDPSQEECINGTAVLTTRSITCCTDRIGGFPATGDAIDKPNVVNPFTGATAACAVGNEKRDFTIADANAQGLDIPTSINLGIGFPNRPDEDTNLPPPANYDIGAEVNIGSTDISAKLLLTAESSDPGELELTYETKTILSSNATSVIAGDVFHVSALHRPDPESSSMSSVWSPIGASARYEIKATPTGTVTFFGYNPYKQESYSNGTPDFQDSTVVNLFSSGELIDNSGEIIGFSAAASDTVELRLLDDVVGAPDILKNKVFAINNDNIEFGDPDVRLNIPAAFQNEEDIIPPGTSVPIEVERGRLRQCPFKGIKNPVFCYGLTGVDNTFGLRPEIEANLLELRFQLPEVNTPVSDDFYAGRKFDLSDEEFFSDNVLNAIEIKRNSIEDNGALVNTVPNGKRPLENYSENTSSATDIYKALFVDQTNLSSDIVRFQLDIDGAATSPANVGLFDKTVGNDWINMTFGLLDLDVVLWAGIDQTLRFEPNLGANISFDKDVMTRLVFADETNPDHESEASLLSAGSTKQIPVLAIFDESNKSAWLEVTQPVGGVNITASYVFDNNEFKNTTVRKTTIAPQLTLLKAGLGGLVIDALTAPLDLLETPFPIPTEFAAAKIVAPTPPVATIDLSDNRPTDENGNGDPNLVRHLPGTTTGALSRLFIVERALDADADGLPDSIEQTTCTSELDADTDDDGLGDGIEDINRNGIVDVGETDPCNPDTDSDGLSDGFERGVVNPVLDPDGSGPAIGTDLTVFAANPNPIVRTHPLLIDTDRDGFTDGYEIANGFDPNNSTDPSGDSDNDGLGNTDELSIYGTDVLNSDSDGDFVSDGDEVFITITDPANTDPFAELYVTEKDSDQVLRINSDGARTLISGVDMGSGPALVDPMGIVITPGVGATDDSILIINMGASSLLRIDPATGDRTIVSDSTRGNGTNFDVPIDLVLEDANSVLVTDQGAIDRIFRVNLSTGNREVVVDGTSGIAPSYLALEPSGSIVVAFQTSGDVRRYTIGIDGSMTEVALTTPILGVDDLAGIAVQPDGRIVASANNNVQLYETDGTFVSQTNVPVTTPRGVVAPYSGGAIVSNWDNAETNDSIGIVNFNNNKHSTLSSSVDLPPIDYPEGLALRALIDSDFDGLGDIDEFARGLNPQSSDTDGDGLLDGDEFIIGSDPNKIDSDDDGFSDFDEVNAGSNPMDAGSRPNDADADGDGVVDTFDNCTEDVNTDQRDTDGDGFGNICDADFDNNNIVNAQDIVYFRKRFRTYDPNIDLDGNGEVNNSDFAILRSQLFKAPGPSGLNK